MRSIFLAVTLTTAYAHLSGWPAELHPVLRACFAVLVLVLGIGMWRRRDRPACSQARSVRAARWPDYLAIGIGVLAIECLFLFFLTAVPPKAEELAIDLEEALLPERAAARVQSQAANGTGGGNHATAISGNWLWDDQGKRRLPLTSNAQPSNKPEAFFRPVDEATRSRLLRSRAYLRAFTLERFEDSSWSPHSIEARLLVADDDGVIRLPEPSSRPGPVLRGKVTHPAQANGQNVMTTLQGAIEVGLPELRQIAPGTYRLNPLRNPEGGYNYDTASRPLSFHSILEDGLLDSMQVPRPNEVPEHLVELPDEPALSQALIDLAIRTQGPVESRLLALRKMMHQEYDYSLRIENEDGRDPILNFLLHEKKGHCEFFATAGALLCRSLNIPARVAYGWTGGRYFGAQNLLMFRARDAHAWTEVYLKDVGWVVFDTTPPSALDFTVAPAEELAPIDEEGNIIDEPEPQYDEGSLERWAYLALGIGVVLLPLGLFILFSRRRPRRHDPDALSAELIPDAPGYLSRFRQACAQLGIPMPTGRTLRQQLAALEKEDRRPEFADDLLDYHYTVTYGNGRPSRLKESVLIKAIRRWG